jgi:acyl-CoA synthetase (AMP-forming)/AMP-acid ligase II
MNILSILEKNTDANPDKVALGFFTGPSCSYSELKTLTYQEFIHKAYAVAQYLIEHGASPSDRVLIILPQSLDYLVVFYGCLYAQLIAVSLFPPSRANHIHRVKTVAVDAKSKFVITDSFTLNMLLSNSVDIDEKEPISSYINVANILTENYKNKYFILPNIDNEAIAYLQYTSGSTSDPKGVVITHANLMSNLGMQQKLLDTDSNTNIVSWLPFTHDMGLVGVPIASLYLGATAYITTPIRFIKQPRIWLEAITAFGGTLSWAPNFAYEMCVEEIPEEERIGLDLSSWRTAVNAAEPVRANTIKKFISCYMNYGFNEKAIKVLYGLAEATLVVSGTRIDDKVHYEELDCDILQTQQKAVLANDNITQKIKNVSNGCKIESTEVVIVDPITGIELDARKIGEVWVLGSHVCKGYWGKITLTKETFEAYTASGNGPFLRTGDLGYLNEKNELFIVGRSKDVIIIRGKNYAASDIEQTVESAGNIIKENFVAAFSVELDEREQLIIVIEIRILIEEKLANELLESIQKLLRIEHGIVADKIIFAGRSAVSRTTSGKVQRQICKQNYLAGRIHTLKFTTTSCSLDRGI